MKTRSQDAHSVTILLTVSNLHNESTEFYVVYSTLPAAARIADRSLFVVVDMDVPKEDGGCEDTQELTAALAEWYVKGDGKHMRGAADSLLDGRFPTGTAQMREERVLTVVSRVLNCI